MVEVDVLVGAVSEYESRIVAEQDVEVRVFLFAVDGQHMYAFLHVEAEEHFIVVDYRVVVERYFSVQRTALIYVEVDRHYHTVTGR